MLHNYGISSLCLSKDNEILASGDLKGNVKIWRISTGKCLKKFEKVFQDYISFMIFGRDISHLIISNKDIKVMGMKSGNMLKEFKSD